MAALDLLKIQNLAPCLRNVDQNLHLSNISFGYIGRTR